MISISESKLGLSHRWLLRPSQRYGTLQSGYLTQRLPITARNVLERTNPTDWRQKGWRTRACALLRRATIPKRWTEAPEPVQKTPSLTQCFLNVPRATQPVRTFPCWVLQSISRRKRKTLSNRGALSPSPSSKAVRHRKRGATNRAGWINTTGILKCFQNDERKLKYSHSFKSDRVHRHGRVCSSLGGKPRRKHKGPPTKGDKRFFFKSQTKSHHASSGEKS